MIQSSPELVDFLRSYHASLLAEEPPRPLEPAPFEIPRSLDILYRTFGHLIDGWRGPLNAQDFLRVPAKLEAEGGKVFFLDENQNCWNCAYAEEFPHPVFRYEENEPTVLQCDSLEVFLITFGLQEALMSSPWLVSTDDATKAEDLGLILEPLLLGGSYAYESASHAFWITGHGEIVADLFGQLWIGSYAPLPPERRRRDFTYNLISCPDAEAERSWIARLDPPPKAPGFLARAIGKWFPK